jgi:DNA-binding CsgD family transcriptional regulator
MDNHYFSERENDVIRFLLQGKSNKQIALELGIASRTVEFHLSNIYAKLGVHSRAEAILKFAEQPLRESTDRDLRETTVPPSSESIHNVRASNFMKRIQMNKSFIVGVGLLVLTSVLCIGSLYTMAKQREQEAPFAAATPASVSSTSESMDMVTPVSSASTLPPNPTDVVIPSHTVNGYTATIESYYVDISHVNFQVRITGGEVSFGDKHFYDRIGNADLYDENGNRINTSGGWEPAVDPTLIEFGFVPVTLFKGDRFKGQFAFNLNNAPAYDQILAQFRFDVDLPIEPELRFYPKQASTAGGLEMFLDSVTVTPRFTQVYLCFPPPSFAPWTIASQSVLQMGEQEASASSFRLLFDSSLGGDKRAGSEPYWVPPTKNGRCLKAGFPIGSSNPTSLTLTIPELENIEPDILMTTQLLTDYPGLNAKEAYATYLEEHGKTYKGPWRFKINLTP